MPDFSQRVHAEEMMDDFSISDERLTRALSDLRWVNRWLGGYAATRAALAPLLQTCDTLRVIDLGAGGADHLEHVVQWGARRGCTVEAVAVDANPQTVAYAQSSLDHRLPPRLRSQVEVVCADALDLPYADNAFDVAVAALFLHHFHDQEAVTLLQEMDRVARCGILVNDLHRHPVAYYSIRALGALTQASEMFRHDAPLSVLRGFRRDELTRLAAEAGLGRVRIRWHWAFRWVLTTMPRPPSSTTDSAGTPVG